MPLRIVQSKQNARLKDLRRALSHPFRESSREGRGLAAIEGPHLIEEALRAELRFECVFVAEGSERLLDALPLPPEIEILLLPRALLDSALTTETPQSVAALVVPPDWTWADLLAGPRKSPPLLLVLAGLQDPGNLGAILRSAEAFGADGVLTLPGTVSAWNPKAVRASAGSIFRVPLLVVKEEECFNHLKAGGVTVFTTAVHGGTPAELARLDRPVAFLIGNEGNGVPDDLALKADGSLTISCPGAVESLNAAVAASVLLYEASRQRVKMKPGGWLQASNE
jgi:TrmH family RNA methyltransferase